MIAIIPAKYNSKRVKNKNIIPFYKGKSLLELKIEQLKEIDRIDDIYVNSESDKILDIAKKCGVKGIKRLEYFAKDNTPIEEVYMDIIDNIPNSYHDVIYTPVTSPLIRNKTYEDAIDIYSKYDNIVSFTVVKDYLWDEDGPINYDIDNQVKSQNLQPLYKMTSNFFIFNKSNITDGILVSRDCYKYFVDYPECLDIDTKEDFNIAKLLYEEERD